MQDSTITAQFSVGSVLGRSFSTLFKNPLVFFGLTLIATLPPHLVQLTVPSGTLEGLALPAIVAAVLSMIFSFVVQGAIAYAVYQELRGRKAGFGSALSTGLARVGWLILAAFLVSLGISIGLVLLIIPGLILMCLWSVTIQACVVEKLGPLASMGRSGQLTKGYRLPIFGLLLIVGVANYAFVLLAGYLGVTVFSNPLALALIGGVLAMLPAAFNNVMSAIIYSDLRAVKEGVTLDSLANVFD